MDKFNDIKEIGLLYENGLNMWAIADSQQKNQAHNNMPTSDVKNSYANANSTSNLPGNTAKTNTAGIPSFGENEEVVVKGYGKMTRKQVKNLVNKTIDALYQMKQNGKYNQMRVKLELLDNLLKHVKGVQN
jgi:hypothetical protein